VPTQEHSVDLLNTNHLHADLKGRSVRGGLVTIASQGAQFLMQSVATIVLARLLTPTDFGIVAMVTAITGLASAFTDFGLSEATIQRKDITHEQVSTLFWINVAVGLGLTLVTAALGPVLAGFYREPRLINITLLLSLTFFMGGLRVQPTALLKRQMRFSSLAFRDVASYALAVPIAITMAWRGVGYWALVALPLMLNFTQMVVSWMMVRWKPGLPRRDAKVGSMVAFGGKVSASYLILNMNRSLDGVLIGWYWGAAPLGLYSRAYNLLMLPVRQLSVPASSVTIPAFSRLQDEPERFARYYLRAIGLIIWITAPLFGFLFVAAKPVIVLVLGAKWGNAVPVFQILVISALGQLLLESTVWLFVSRGQSKRLLRLLFVISPIIVGSFVVGLPFGIRGVALAGSLVLLIILPGILKFAFRGTTLTFQRLGEALIWPVSLSLGGAFCSELGLHLIRPDYLIWQLLVPALGFVVVFSLSTILPSVRAEMMSLRRLLSDLRPAGNTGQYAAERDPRAE